LIFSPDGKRIVSGHDDGTVRIWNAEQSRQIKSRWLRRRALRRRSLAAGLVLHGCFGPHLEGHQQKNNHHRKSLHRPDRRCINNRQLGSQITCLRIVPDDTIFQITQVDKSVEHS
jgi:WD40 repeat protein